MSVAPPAAVLINNDLTPENQLHIETQLFINQTLDGYSFDGYVAINPDFVKQLKLNSQRLLILRDLRETQNRDQIDLVLFIKNGLATSLKNNFGPPVLAHSVFNLNWKEFGFF